MPIPRLLQIIVLLGLILKFLTPFAFANSEAALQPLGTSFAVKSWHITLAENDFFFADRNLTHFSQIRLNLPIEDSTSLNLSLKYAIHTPRLIEPKVIREKGKPYWSTTDDAFHTLLFLETQAVKRVYLTNAELLLATYIQLGLDSPELIGEPIQNLFHIVLPFPFADHMGVTQFYSALGASGFIRYPINISLLWGRKTLGFGLFTDISTLEQSFGAMVVLQYYGEIFDDNSVAGNLFVLAKGLNTRLYSIENNYEQGIRFLAGAQVNIEILKSPFTKLNIKLLYDYNSISPHLSHFRHTFIPSISLAIPLN